MIRDIGTARDVQIAEVWTVLSQHGQRLVLTVGVEREVLESLQVFQGHEESLPAGLAVAGAQVQDLHVREALQVLKEEHDFDVRRILDLGSTPQKKRSRFEE